MKIRTGFVSNSSSASFVILGIQLDMNKMEYQDVLTLVGITEVQLATWQKNNQDVTAGYYVDRDADFWRDCFWELIHEGSAPLNVIVSDRYVWVGKSIAHDDGCGGLDRGMLTWAEMEAVKVKMEQALPGQELGIYAGTYAC